VIVQVSSDWPPRSVTIVGSATLTIVWSSAPRNSPSMIATRISIFARLVEVEGCETVDGAVVVPGGHGFQGGSFRGKRQAGVPDGVGDAAREVGHGGWSAGACSS